eukprot:110111-Pelagomonas_calceolata.AAC.2
MNAKEHLPLPSHMQLTEQVSPELTSQPGAAPAPARRTLTAWLATVASAMLPLAARNNFQRWKLGPLAAQAGGADAARNVPACAVQCCQHLPCSEMQCPTEENSGQVNNSQTTKQIQGEPVVVFVSICEYDNEA